MAASPVFLSGLLVLCFSIMAAASDPSSLQDFCVADPTGAGIITLICACLWVMLIYFLWNNICAC